ncbi:MAG: tyrosine recombinase [Verrucomicrobiota bacterium]
MNTPEIWQTLEDCLAYLAMEKGHSTNTQLLNRAVLERFGKWVSTELNCNRVWDQLSLRDIQNYLAIQKKSRKLSPASLKNEVVTLRNFFRFLHQEKIISRDIAICLDIPKLYRYLPEILSEEEVSTILSFPFSDTILGNRDRAILETLYACGLRISELANMRTECLNLTENTLQVIGKGNKERLVLIGQKASEAIDYYLTHSRPKLLTSKSGSEVFLSRLGSRLTNARIWQVVKTIVQNAGIQKNVYPHLLRHSFATHMLSHGADLRVIQELLGHANISTTEIYTQIEHTRLRQVHQNFHPRANLKKNRYDS